MPEKMPKSPFRERPKRTESAQDDGREIPKTHIDEEIRAALGFFEFTRRLRAKNPDNPEDTDKSPEDVAESVGDHIAMTAYLMHYFLPLLESSGEKLDYARTFDMVLAHDVVHAAGVRAIPSVQKTPDMRRDEILTAAELFGELPRRGGFNRDLFNAYSEYLGQSTTESRFVHALSGLETMMYTLSRPEHMRATLVGGKGYAVEDYRERISPFCQSFPPMYQFYTRIERLFHQGSENYFAPSRMYTNNIARPETMQNMFEKNAPDFGDPTNIDITDENERLLKFQHLKRELRFSGTAKSPEEYHDTLAEHVASFLFLNRYFFAPTKEEALAQHRKGAKSLDLRESNEMVLAHDASEGITGDKISPRKTEADARDEWDAAIDIAADYAPRAGGFSELFWKRIDGYELDRADKAPFVGNAWYLKALDMFEAQLYIFDPETRIKVQHMTIMTRDAVHKKIEPILRLFPTLAEHFNALDKRFHEEGLP